MNHNSIIQRIIIQINAVNFTRIDNHHITILQLFSSSLDPKIHISTDKYQHFVVSRMNMKSPMRTDNICFTAISTDFKIVLKIIYFIRLTRFSRYNCIHKKSPFPLNLYFIIHIGTIIQISEEKGNFF